VSKNVTAALAANARLSRVESLLDEALRDLTAFSGETPGSRCAAALAEAAAELQAFSQVAGQVGSQSATFRKLLSAFHPRLCNLKRLLASAADFYRGWCAAAPAANQAESYCSQDGYQFRSSSGEPGPALLAFRG
jgi:putative hemolysin